MYMQVAKAQDTAPLPDRVSIEGFLRIIRGSRRRAWHEEMGARTAKRPSTPTCRAAPAIQGRPRRLPDSIAGLPTSTWWRPIRRGVDLDAYRWLGTFAKSHLKVGGLLLAQCGTHDVPPVLDVLRQTGLTYQWLLAIVYQASDSPVVSAAPS